MVSKKSNNRPTLAAISPPLLDMPFLRQPPTNGQPPFLRLLLYGFPPNTYVASPPLLKNLGGKASLTPLLLFVLFVKIKTKRNFWSLKCFILDFLENRPANILNQICLESEEPNRPFQSNRTQGPIRWPTY